MSVISRIKDWFKKTFSSNSSNNSSARRARTVSNYGGGGSRSYRSYSDGGYTAKQPVETREQRMKRETQERQQKQKQITDSLSKITDVKSAGKTAQNITSSISGIERVTRKIGEKAKQTPPDPKREAILKAQNRRDEEQKEFNRVTNNRYNTETGTAEQKARARQRIKSGEYQEDPDVAMHAVKYHPVTESLTRGALSGASLGLSDAAAKKLTKGRAREAEEYYQKNKNKYAEFGGEMLGSLATFGLTGEASAKALSKAVPAGVKEGSEKVAEKLLRRAAEKEAVKRFGVEGATKEVIEQIARRKAAQAVGELGKDASINFTSGLVSDLAHSYADSNTPEEFGRSMATNAAMNAVLGGATSLIPAFRVSKNADTELLEDLLSAASRNADEGIERTVADAVEPPRVAEAVEPPRVTETVEPPPLREETPRATPPDEFPYEDTPEAEEMVRRLREGRAGNNRRARNEREALENRARQIADEPPKMNTDEPLRVNNVSEDTPITDRDTMGQAMSKSAYERNTGETIDEGVRSTWDQAWQASKEYHESHATGQKNRLSRTSVSQLNMMSSDAEHELREKGIKEGWLNYNVIHSEDMLDKVSKQFRDDPDRYVKEMIDVNNGKTLDFRATPEWQARAHYIMAVVDPSADAASEIAYTEAFKLATQMSSKAGQTNNLRRQFVQLTPMGRRDAIMDELTTILYNSDGFRRNHPDMPSDKYDGLAYIKAILEDDPEIEQRVQALVNAGGMAKQVEFGAKEAAEATAKETAETAAEKTASPTLNVDDMAKTSDELPVSRYDDLTTAHAELIATLNTLNPKTKFDVLQEIRYLNMLGNPKTHIRNVFGSGFFGPIRQVSNAIRSGIEDSVLKNTNLEIARHGGLSLSAAKEAWAKKPTTEAGKKALSAFETLKPDILGSLKHDNQLYKGRATTLPGKMLDTVSDFNSHLLSWEDDFFKEKAFRENYVKSYNKYLKNGTPITDKIERQIEAEAMQEAQIATFNEFNELAQFLANIERKASNPNASTLGRWGGRAVNAVMPFTKVPANIMKQSVNYSPVGLLKGFTGIRSALKKQDSKALNKAIDELASGMTGAGIFAMGMLLGRMTDAFTTNAGKDDAAAKFKKAQGVQNYSVTFTPPGSDQKYSMTLDWLVPNSATFFSGVELANQMKTGDFDILDLGGDWAQVASRLIEPVMETSMLSGLYSMLESTRGGYGDDDKQSALGIMMRETAQSYMNSMIPTIAGQIARTSYDSDLQVTGEDDWEYFRNQLKSKVGLGESDIFGEALGADTDAYGNIKGEKKYADDRARSFLKNFLSPANIQKVDISELDEQKIAQYEEAVRSGADPQQMAYLFPKKQYKKQFTTGNLDVKLSNKDLSTYNQAKTTGGAEGMRTALESIIFNRYGEDEKGKKTILLDGYTDEEKQQLIKQFEGRSIREVEEWLYDQPGFKNATPAEQKKVIDHLWNLSGQGKSVGAKRAGEQAVIEAQGGDVNEYNFNNEITEKKREALQPFIDNGTLTYEEAVDFAREAGKTYYYENDEGGTSSTYYNKAQMMEYLESKGIPADKAAALYNAFKNGNAKEYGTSSSRSGRRRGGYRRRSGSRGGSSKKAKVPTPKTIKASQLVKGEALVSKKSSSSAKATLPQLKRVEAKIDLPTKKKR